MTSFFAAPTPRNAAVRIVAPDAAYSAPATPKGAPGFSSPKKDTTQKQCRNIMIHGYCKFEGKGCVFQHPSDVESQPEEDAPRLSADAASFTPFAATPAPSQASAGSVSTEEAPSTPRNDGTSSAMSATFPVQAVNAPVFVPTRTLTSPKRAERNATVYSPPPSDEASASGYDTYGSASEDMGDAAFDGMVAQMDQLNYHDYGQHADNHAMLAHDYNGMASMDSYFHSQQHFIRQPLNYHLYTDPIPSNPGGKFFIADSLREDLQKRAEQIHLGSSPNIDMQLPEDVQGYHSLVPLEMTPSSASEKDAAHKRKTFGMSGQIQAILYKATKANDGRVYALRRIENYRLMNERALAVVEKWAKIQHPGIVAVHEAFTTRAFGDSSLVVVYDYHPSAQSLAELYFRPPGTTTGHSSNGLNTPTSNGRSFQSSGQNRNSQSHLQIQPDKVSEGSLWSYIFQIASAIRVVHEAGLALRVIDPSKVLKTGQNRVRISCCSLLDIFEADARQEGYTQAYQQEDLIMLAKLILTVACGNPMAVNNVHKALDHVHRFYPGQIKDVVHLLMKAPGPHKNIQSLFDSFGGRLVNEVDEAHAAVDRLEGELMGELENARLVRLLCKFGFINERPEFDRDPRWSETGDRYILKLFRDFVFHSVDEQGNPVVNLGHVLTHLNKLDAASEERLMLVSRDEQSCLVVTYKEIKNCVESAFNELSRR